MVLQKLHEKCDHELLLMTFHEIWLQTLMRRRDIRLADGIEIQMETEQGMLIELHE